MKTFFLGDYGVLACIGITLFLFFFIFGMPTPVGSLTPLLTLGVVIWAIFNYKKYFLIIPKEVFYLFIFLFFDLFICLTIPYFFGTYDFSIIQTKINFLASILATFILAKSFSSNDKITDKQFFNLLLSLFAIQTILVITMLANSDLSQIVTSFTRSSDQGTRVLESYAGARGLGIADSSAFGFAIVMGLFIFLTFFSYKNNIISFKYFFALLLLGGVASISAGRTAILGLVFGIVYLFLNFRNIRSFLTLISTFLILIVAGYLLLSIDRNSIQNETLGYFYSYSMEPILNYINEGSLASSSTDALHNMYFPLTEKQFLIGDGLELFVCPDDTPVPQPCQHHGEGAFLSIRFLQRTGCGLNKRLQFPPAVILLNPINNKQDPRNAKFYRRQQIPFRQGGRNGEANHHREIQSHVGLNQPTQFLVHPSHLLKEYSNP